MMNDSGGSRQDMVGLCARCAHVRLLESHRGTRFYLCRLSASDPRFPKYPTLPVVECSGFTERDSGPGGGDCRLPGD